MKTSAGASLPQEPQELVKTSTEKLLEARADTNPLLWGPASFPSCFLGPDIHREMWQPQQPHLMARWLPSHVSTPQGRTGWGRLRECKVGPIQAGVPETQLSRVLASSIYSHCEAGAGAEPIPPGRSLASTGVHMVLCPPLSPAHPEGLLNPPAQYSCQHEGRVVTWVPLEILW